MQNNTQIPFFQHIQLSEAQQKIIESLSKLSTFSTQLYDLSEKLTPNSLPPKAAEYSFHILQALRQKEYASRPTGWYLMPDHPKQTEWMIQDSIYVTTISHLVSCGHPNAVCQEIEHILSHYPSKRLCPRMKNAYLQAIQGSPLTSQEAIRLIPHLHRYVDLTSHKTLGLKTIVRLTPYIQELPEADKAIAARQLLSLFSTTCKRTGPIDTDTLLTALNILAPYATEKDKHFHDLYQSRQKRQNIALSGKDRHYLPYPPPENPLSYGSHMRQTWLGSRGYGRGR